MIKRPESPRRDSRGPAPWTDLSRGPIPLFAAELLAVVLVVTYLFGHPFGIGATKATPPTALASAPTSAPAQPTVAPPATQVAGAPATPTLVGVYPAAVTTQQPATPSPAAAYPAAQSANTSATAAATSTGTAASTSACDIQPVRGFGLFYSSVPSVASRLGCATGAETGTSLTVQTYANGLTVDAPAQHTTYILGKDGKWSSQPDGSNATPAALAALGTPSGSARNVGGALESFQHGTLLWTPDKLIYALYADGGWEQHPDTFVDPTATPKPASQAPAPTPSLAPASAVASCPSQPVRGFALVYNGQPNVANRLGCASAKEVGFSGSQQSFEHGLMVERFDTRQVFVIHADGSWAVYADTYQSGQPLPSAGTPPAKLVAPAGGIGLVWQQQSDVRQALGWATGPAQNVSGAWQAFAGGQMLWTSDRKIYVLYADRSGAQFPDQFVDPTPTATN